MARLPYAVQFAPAADRQLKRLPTAAQQRIVLAAEGLATDPRPAGSLKLAGDDELYRIRVGDYRLTYQIADARLIVLVVRVAHRKDAYRKK